MTSDLPTYEYITDAAEIYRISFSTIEAEADLSSLAPDMVSVAVRMMHAAGQTDLPADLEYSPGMVASCREALANGAPVFCDVQMVASGVIRSRMPANNEVICYMGDPKLGELAKELGTTRSAAAIEWWKPRLEGAVVAIGNAPTALFRLLEVARDEGIRPAGMIGCPVGFVGAAESKRALAENPYGLEYLVLRGRRGGSAVTCSAMNAISQEKP